MNMHVETQNRRAFEFVTEALLDLDLYKTSKDRARLDSAQSNLADAMSADPRYLRAVYINAMVSDLQGNPKEAVAGFERVLRESPPFADEVRYNLAVASYHRYSHEHLDRAIQYFSEVLNNQNLKDEKLKLLARSGRAQAYAMHEIPKNPAVPQKDEIEIFFKLSNADSVEVLQQVKKADVPEEIKREVKWTAYNAQGMAIMYYTDFFLEREGKIAELKKAVTHLAEADKYNPNDWANYCDMGSAQMRLGYWLKKNQSNAAPHFEKALEYLGEVVDDLRPNYGFALYEIGRVFRLRGDKAKRDFIKAQDYLARALQIDADDREVGNERVERERNLAAAEHDDYP